MRYLLDTDVVLWFLAGHRRLSARAREAIVGADAAVVSSASIWEIAIKVAAGRLVAPEDLPTRLRENGMEALDIAWEHGRVAGSLPALHRDSFDRMLVAQALAEGLTIVTADRAIAQYDVPVLAA